MFIDIGMLLHFMRMRAATDTCRTSQIKRCEHKAVREVCGDAACGGSDIIIAIDLMWSAQHASCQIP
jgi:hypothetical protein